jgi:hypothetical protein
MQQGTADLEFTLHSPSASCEVGIRLRRFGSRWVAQSVGGGRWVGVGDSPRSALAAAVHPLGATASREMLADLSLLEPSIELVRHGPG